MKKVLIVLFVFALSMLFAGAAYAADDGFTNTGVGFHYLMYTGDNDNIESFGMSIFGMKNNWLFDLGFSNDFDSDSVYGDVDLGTTIFLDGSYIWYSDPETTYGMFGGLGAELLYADEFLIGVIGQVGYQWDNGWQIRAKYGLLTEDVKPLYFVLGISF